MDYILETRNLTKKIKKENIIKGISLKVPKGETYGLLGPNGAGKSTTMKLLCGLLKPSGGEILFNGKKWSKDTLNKIGVLIENPAIYGNLTAKENMKIHACMLDVSEDEILRVLKLLKIDKTGKKKVSNFSLGMKQRLGIAIALLGNPDFVILDEPTNGLDPIGIQELRELIKQLNHNGVTVLISSHNLAEVQNMASYVGIIINGKLKYESKVVNDDNLENIFINVTKEEEYSYV
ncbi:MAG: lantibiotic protection ABC transporter ATP-binding subunit [Ruminococcus bicirculans (ex Wegman et al. 2014)]